MKLFFSFILAIIVFSGCNNPPKPVVPAKPSWIENHTVGAVGICDTHIRGDAVQEEVAMDRALKKLAKAKASAIQTSSASTQSEKAGRYNSKYESTTQIKSNTKINAQIKATWRNPSNNRYYIWMLPN